MVGNIVIAGSCLIALSMKAERFPQVGETVVANMFFEETGGKGTNQAIAASKLGSRVSLIGCVGNDKFGKAILQDLNKFTVDTQAVRIDDSCQSGTAFILINDHGDNMISILPGANFKLTNDDFENNLDVIRKSDIIGFQLENNIDFVEYGIKRANELGIKTLLDPAPARHLNDSVYAHLDYIKPNESEASLLTKISVTDIDSAFKAAEWFLDKGVKNSIITLGQKGVVILNHKIKHYVVPPKTKAADPTGAGDIFSGALMHCLTNKMDLTAACEFAVYAATFSVRQVGVIQSMPTEQEVIDFRNSQT